jgi:hypothetical protein
MAGGSLRRVLAMVVGAGVGAGCLVVATAGPVPARIPVSRASASAATVTLAGERVGTGVYTATHDGDQERTTGRDTPVLPLLEQQAGIVGGALGQDATARGDGTSVACAGLVGRGGTVRVGPDGSCLVERTGRIELSLGSLDQLGLGDVLASAGPLELPDLPEPLELPELELRVEGRAVTASCRATPHDVTGSASVLDASVVAVVAGQRLAVATITPDGARLELLDVLDKLAELPELPGLGSTLRQLLDQLPSDQLPTGDLLTVATDERVREAGGLRVTALRVGVVPDQLADVTVGTVSCGPNHVLPRTPASPTPTPTRAPTPTVVPTLVPTAVPAGLAAPPPGTTATRPVARPGLAGLALMALAGVAVGALLHRRRRRV